MSPQLFSDDTIDDLRHESQVRNGSVALRLIGVKTRFLHDGRDDGSLLTDREETLSEGLHISQIKGSRVSTDFSRISVGSGSSEHVLGGELRRSFRTLVWCQVSVSVNTSIRRVVMTSDSTTARSVTERTFSNPRRSPVHCLSADR